MVGRESIDENGVEVDMYLDLEGGASRMWEYNRYKIRQKVVGNPKT